MPPELRQYIRGDKATCGYYGRFTEFYAKIGNKEIPVYQPGTVMFASAVKEGSDLAVVAHGSQQNGAILGNGCAQFLSRFIAQLAQCYELKVQEKGMKAWDDIDNDSYMQALTETLR